MDLGEPEYIIEAVEKVKIEYVGTTEAFRKLLRIEKAEECPPAFFVLFSTVYSCGGFTQKHRLGNKKYPCEV